MIHVKRFYQTILNVVQNDCNIAYLDILLRVLTSTKRNFQIWMWMNSVLYSGYRNERRKNFR